MTTQLGPLPEETPPELEDSIGGLNERYPILDNSLGRSEFMLYIRNLHLGYENNIIASQQLTQKIIDENSDEELITLPNLLIW